MPRTAKLSFALALVMGAAALAAAPISAATSITVSPAVVSLEAGAGSDGHIEINVSNSGDTTFDIVTGVTPFQAMEGDRSAIDWASVRPARMHLKPGASRSASVRIVVPDDIDSGGRYVAITFATVPPKSEGNVASIAGRVAVPLLLAVRGDGPLTRSPVVERFAPVIEADGRFGFRAEILNGGNVHTPVSGSVTVGLPDADPYASLEITERIVLPDVAKVLSSHGTLPLPIGERFVATATFLRPGVSDPDDAIGVPLEFAFDSTPQLTLLSGDLCENLDRGPTIHGLLGNPGDVGLMPAVRFEVRDDQGVLVDSATPAGSTIVWPGEDLEVSAQFAPRLVSGRYTLTTTATFGAEAPVERTTPFSIGGDPATAAPLCAAALEPGVTETDPA